MSWLLPGDFDGILREGFDVHVRWLGYGDHGGGRVVEDAVCLHVGLVEGEGEGVCDSDALGVDSVTTSEAEGDPVLLTDVGLVEWEIDFVDGSSVLWRKYLDLS